MNTIVIVSDTFRYDHIGANGNDWIKTPELDAFAKIAVNFDRCTISSFPTIPTRTDWFTGRYTFPFHGWQPLDPKATILAGELASAGYINQLIADSPHLMTGTNHFQRGFHGFEWIRGQEHGFEWIRGQEGDTPLTWMNHPIAEQVPFAKTRQRPTPFGATLANKHAWQNRWWDGEEDTFVARTCRTACRWLEQNYKAEKFFLWVDCFDVHEPWDPPQYLVDLYDRSGYDGPPMRHPNYGPASDYTAEELRNLRAHYAGECTLVSKHVGRLLRMAEDTGIMERTALFFMADHGMYLGEHNRAGKSNICPHDERGSWPFYEEVAHIPLMVYLPGAAGGRRVASLVQPPDIMPTILELAGAPAPEGMHGHSLVPLLRGEESGWPRPAAFSGFDLTRGEGKNGPKVTVTNAEWSLLLGADGHCPAELYHRPSDPGQRQDLIAAHPDAAAALHAELRAFLQRIGSPAADRLATLGGDTGGSGRGQDAPDYR
jgi:arylsulfatase A-like enzyme